MVGSFPIHDDYDPAGEARHRGLRRLSRLTWGGYPAWCARDGGLHGPCMFGLPAVADAMADLAYRGGRGRMVERVATLAGLVDGRGACRHPDGAVQLVRSALRVNPIACNRHGLCAELLPEIIELDPWGYSILMSAEVPRSLVEHAKRAVAARPVLALALVTYRERP